MPPLDDFVHIPTHRSRHPHPHPHSHPHHPSPSKPPSVSSTFYTNTSGPRVLTSSVIASAIRTQHPSYHLTITPSYTCDLLAFASSGHASYKPHGPPSELLIKKEFQPPARRYGDEDGGGFVERVVYGCFEYEYEGTGFLLYSVVGQDGMYPATFWYLLEDVVLELDAKTPAKTKSMELLAAASKWLLELHGEVLVFDQGYWQKSKDLYDNTRKAEWSDVILEKERKAAIIEDIIGFFNSEARYAEFGVPWKRGVIFYGPPGNGKTISTKALMNDVSKRTNPVVESLYVKTFAGYGGPEYSIRQIFQMARRMAPCLLIFEDMDSLILPNVRSYFLNEVDGLESNHGILMIGSTNHLERLDPGIAKRPSRFDRKYLFDVPNHDERIQYCEYWRKKLESNKKIEFPEEMSARIADITEKFSFAYMKEAFVASLLSIVRDGDTNSNSFTLFAEDKLANNILWKELQKQITNLRREMEGEDPDDDDYAVPSPLFTQPSQPSQASQSMQQQQSDHIVGHQQPDHIFHAPGYRAGFPSHDRVDFARRPYPSFNTPHWELGHLVEQQGSASFMNMEMRRC